MIVAAAVGVSACFRVANVAVLAEQAPSHQYRVLATNKTSTMQKEVLEAAAEGYQFVGFSTGSTFFGGNEVVTIMRRPREWVARH